VVLGLILSLAIGVSLGLLGGGGSILTVPILVYAFGLEGKQAIATSLLVVGVTSAAAMVPHAVGRRVDFRVGITFGAASMVGAFAGGRLAHFLPSSTLLAAFAVMMVVTGLAMLRGRPEQVAGEARMLWGRVLVTGVLIGLLTGVIGAGGGFVIVPALALLCGLPMQKAVATSLFVIAMNSFAGFAGYIGSVPVDVRLAGLVTGAAVIGSVIGASFAGRVQPATLRRAFAWLVLAMSVYMLARQTTRAVAAVAALVIVAAATLLLRRPQRAPT
jgi:uncharacterized protein